MHAPVDLKKAGIKLVLAAPEVPVGNYARQSFALMAKDAAYGADFSDTVLKNVVSNESNVKQVVTKVQLGEARCRHRLRHGRDEGRGRRSAQVDHSGAAQRDRRVPHRADEVARPNAAVAEGIRSLRNGPDGQAILKKYGFQTS